MWPYSYRNLIYSGPQGMPTTSHLVYVGFRVALASFQEPPLSSAVHCHTPSTDIFSPRRYCCCDDFLPLPRLSVVVAALCWYTRTRLLQFVAVVREMSLSVAMLSYLAKLLLVTLSCSYCCPSQFFLGSAVRREVPVPDDHCSSTRCYCSPSQYSSSPAVRRGVAASPVFVCAVGGITRTAVRRNTVPQAMQSVAQLLPMFPSFVRG